MIIYRTTDRIPVKIGEATFWIAPLSGAQKTELLSMTLVKSGEERFLALAHACRTIAMSVKAVTGIQNADGEEYVLSFDANGDLTKECVEELITVDGADKLVTVAGAFALSQFGDPKLDGVVVDFSKVQTLKKK